MDAEGSAPRGFALPRAARITQSGEIRELFRRGKRRKTRHLDAFVSPSPSAFPRWGVVVPKHKHEIVERNRVKRRLREAGRTLPIVFLSGQGEIPMSVQAIKAGAADFLTKPVTSQALTRAVRNAIEQDAVHRQTHGERAELERRFATLTPREREVLVAVAKGRLNKQIAGDLGIVEQTVKYHRARIMERMQAHTAAELMHIAATLGIHRQG